MNADDEKRAYVAAIEARLAACQGCGMAAHCATCVRLRRLLLVWVHRMAARCRWAVVSRLGSLSWRLGQFGDVWMSAEIATHSGRRDAGWDGLGSARFQRLVALRQRAALGRQSLGTARSGRGR